MKKILWFSNHVFSEMPDKATGTWLSAMGWAVAGTEGVQLFNISQARVKSITRADCGTIAQWVVPHEKLCKNGLPSRTTIKGISDVVKMVAPDLIHVWGTENFWGLLTARKILMHPVLLDMQGIKYACGNVYYGGLTFNELIRCNGPKELLKPSISIQFIKHRFCAWRAFEEEIIQGHRIIATQSDWIRSHVANINPDCEVVKTEIMMRAEFMNAEPWTPPDGVKEKGVPIIFTSCGCSTPYKGVHVLLRAVAIVKKHFPCVVLNVAGYISSGIRKSGYERFVEHEVRRLGLSENVCLLGALDASGLIREMHRASVAVVPSFIESYSLALAEALQVGVPCVVSYAGAMPELAKHGESALFFSPGDETMCALQIMKILESPSLAFQLSKKSRYIRASYNNAEGVLTRQFEIYQKAMKSYSL